MVAVVASLLEDARVGLMALKVSALVSTSAWSAASGLPKVDSTAMATDWPPKRPALIRSPSLWLGRAARAP